MDWTVCIVIIAFFTLLFIGVPIGFALTGVAMFGTVCSWGVGSLYQIVSTTYSDSTNFILIAIPLFILMANFLERSGLADDLYQIIYLWSGNLRGGACHWNRYYLRYLWGHVRGWFGGHGYHGVDCPPCHV